jgi:hypothetical protein
MSAGTNGTSASTAAAAANTPRDPRARPPLPAHPPPPPPLAAAVAPAAAAELARAEVERCRLTAAKPLLKKGLCFQRLKLQYDVTISIFSFNFNLRRYTETAAKAIGGLMAKLAATAPASTAPGREVGRCTLTLLRIVPGFSA